jgi:hypothetical protein
MADYNVDEVAAYLRLEDAASRANVSVLQFAQTIIALRGRQESE